MKTFEYYEIFITNKSNKSRSSSVEIKFLTSGLDYEIELFGVVLKCRRYEILIRLKPHHNIVLWMVCGWYRVESLLMRYNMKVGMRYISLQYA